MSWFSGAYEYQLCMDFTWNKLNYCAWFVPSVSSLTLSAMVHSSQACINLSCVRSGLSSRWCYALAVAFHKHNSLSQGTKLRSLFMKYLNSVIYAIGHYCWIIVSHQGLPLTSMQGGAVITIMPLFSVDQEMCYVNTSLLTHNGSKQQMAHKMIAIQTEQLCTYKHR